MKLDTLEGVRVVDLTMWAFVPAAGCVLAQWGADVIKVENPRAPDPMRLHGGSLEPGGASPIFRHYNRGKRAIGVNLASDEGREVLYRLAERADVFLTSYLPATRRKLRVDVEHIRTRNPDIVYAKGTGRGPRGPEAEAPGYDGAIWWARGSLASSAQNGAGTEWIPGQVGHGDGMSGMTLAGGVCAGLLKRALTGVAPVVDASLLSTAMWFNGPQIMQSKDGVPATLPAGADAHRRQPATQTNQYRTRDGRWISLHLLTDPDDLFTDMVDHLGRADLAADPRFSSTASRRMHNEELVAELDSIFATRDLDQWREALATTKGVWAAVQTAAELYEDPQVLANGFIRDVPYPAGPLSLVATPIMFDAEAGEPERAPDFCEHTDEVLSEIGCAASEIAALRNSGAIG
ncbi:MAG: CoA transferase [Acidimicrobiales bacterium]|nr:CoA transferase [Acidimicrobiales bacterium]